MSFVSINFVKKFVNQVGLDLSLFRGLEQYELDHKYDIFIIIFVLGAYDIKRFLKDNKEIFKNEELVSFIRYNCNFFRQCLDVDNEKDKDTFTYLISNYYYHGIMYYVRDEEIGMRVLNILNNHLDIDSSGNFNLGDSSISSIIDELISRHVIIDTFNYDKRPR